MGRTDSVTATMDAASDQLPATARASVALPDGTGEVRTFAVTAPGPDEGWLQVVASGICGTDVALFGRGVAAPMVLGHHVVGRVVALGDEAAERRGLAVGDRVILEEYLPCGQCPTCARGTYRLCAQTDIWRGGRRVGMIAAAEPPGLTGGNAEYTFLPANAVTHKVPEGLSDELAAWVLPYANAIDWLTTAGSLRAEETVLVMGPGYHGLAVAAAARWAGASRVVVTGLRRDAERLAMAEALGARPVIAEDATATADQITRLAEGPVDVVVDAVGADQSVIALATEVLGHGGRLVATYPKQPTAMTIDSATLIRNGLSLTGVRGRSPQAIAAAIRSLAEGSSGLDAVPTVEVGLDDTADMLTRLAAGAGPESPHVVVRAHPATNT